MKRSLLLAGTAMLVCTLSYPDHAQTTTTPDAATDTATTSAVNRGQLTDVVVTAAKRKSTVQKTSESITVVTGEQLAKQNTTTLNTVLENTPGVEMEGGHNEIYIRGIGATSPDVESDVSVNADGVNTGVSQGDGRNSSISTMLDVDRVEVERGPQGTLYGRNADAGVVNIVSNEPKLNKYEGSASFKYGNYNLRNYTLIFNIPIGDTIAIRNAVEKETHADYIRYDTGVGEGGDEDVLTDRFRLLYQPSSNLKFLYTFNYYWDASNTSDGVYNLPLHESDPWTNSSAFAGEIGFSGVQRTMTNQGDIEYDTPWANFSVTPAYSTNEVPCDKSTTTTCTPPTTQTSVEARVTNPTGSRITWTIGFYHVSVGQQGSLTPSYPTTISGFGTASAPGYTGPSSTLYPFAEYPSAVYIAGSEVILPTHSDAIFGQTTIPITQKWRIKAGLRYTDDVKSAEYYAYGEGFGLGTGAGSVDGYAYPTYDSSGNCTNCRIVFKLAPTITRDEYKPLTYLIGTEYDVTPTSMAYAQISTGFKAGGVNSEPPVPPTDYKPEKLTAFEIGTKSRFLQNRLQINADAYYYIYDNYQESLGSQGPVSVTVGGVTYGNPYESTFSDENAGTSHVKGIEAETIAQITPNDRATLNIALNNATLGKLVVPLTLPIIGNYTFNDSGKTMGFAPLWVINGTYSHDFETEYGTFTPQISEKFSTNYNATTSPFLVEFPTIIVDHSATGPALQYRQPAYTKTDLYLNWLSPNGKAQVNAFCKNLLNSAQIDYITPNGDSLSPPRTYGASVTYKF